MNKMTTNILAVLLTTIAIVGPVSATEKSNQIKKIRIASFGAHPDDAEIRSGGTAMLWNQVGSKTLLVSLTNGDVGHFVTSGEALAKRRLKEVQKASEILGTTARVLDIHDGELMPTLENRKEMVRIIREWNADLVIGHRPCDYHPDHRYAGTLMQDTAYMAAVPLFCPETKALKNNPIYLYSYDGFTEPRPFRPDILVPTDSVIEKRIEALVVMESQFVERGVSGPPSWLQADGTQKPNLTDEQAKNLHDKRAEAVREMFRRRYARQADKYRKELIERYGPEVGEKVQYVEAFEICPFGHRPSQKEIRQIFPFLPEFVSGINKE